MPASTNDCFISHTAKNGGGDDTGKHETCGIHGGKRCLAYPYVQQTFVMYSEYQSQRLRRVTSGTLRGEAKSRNGVTVAKLLTNSKTLKPIVVLAMLTAIVPPDK